MLVGGSSQIDFFENKPKVNANVHAKHIAIFAVIVLHPAQNSDAGLDIAQFLTEYRNIWRCAKLRYQRHQRQVAPWKAGLCRRYDL